MNDIERAIVDVLRDAGGSLSQRALVDRAAARSRKAKHLVAMEALGMLDYALELGPNLELVLRASTETTP